CIVMFAHSSPRAYRALHSFPTRRSSDLFALHDPLQRCVGHQAAIPIILAIDLDGGEARRQSAARHDVLGADRVGGRVEISEVATDRKSTRLNSSHVKISYAVFCLKKKKN